MISTVCADFALQVIVFQQPTPGGSQNGPLEV